ncbi:hypothetical protein TNCT_414391 [Trichonephila clavata]|uniref:Uncharacterized protein n=1 Tax=Trichonephila clavata TaxID=2740835 RepID=A0A8X6KR86_TRICU|nr:hypothetical protein TNCT_414391 [Trichonephila clavata]
MELWDSWFHETLVRNFSLGDFGDLRGDSGKLFQVLDPKRMVNAFVRLVSSLQMASRTDFEYEKINEFDFEFF